MVVTIHPSMIQVEFKTKVYLSAPVIGAIEKPCIVIAFDILFKHTPSVAWTYIHNPWTLYFMS